MATAHDELSGATCPQVTHRRMAEGDVAGVIALERAVLQTPGIDGIVLRYGRFYGPGTWTDVPNGPGPLHVDAAAQAALLALTKAEVGVYNVAEDDGAVSSEKARRTFGFDPSFRMNL